MTHQFPLFERLTPHTAFQGGRLTDGDRLSLDDAARMASKHSGESVTVGDFLRAAARGEITMHAVCPRTVTMVPCRTGDKPMHLPERSLPTLPLSACQGLANVGRADWRTYEGRERAEIFGGALCRFTQWQLPEGEPDLVTLPSDCRVTGTDVRALADAFRAPTAAGTTAPAAAEPVPGVFATAKASKTTKAAERVARQDARLAACEAQGMAFDKASLLRMPDGIGALARTMGIERQSLTTEVKAALKRRFEAARNGKG